MEKNMPTLKEFTDLVKKEYLDPEWVVDEKDAMRYFDSEEAQDHIKSEYSRAVKKFRAGEIGIDGFMVGCVSSVANCLYMMYE